MTKKFFQMSYISSVFFDQNNSNTLEKVLLRYSKYSPELINKIHFIFIDDCSPIQVKLPNIDNLNMSLLRIETSIDWNNGGARNLGVNYADTEKLLMTDIDHIFPERTLRHLINRKFNYRDVLRFRRFNGLKKIMSACNVFYINKTLFIDCHGYDEIFSGHYGYEDTHLFLSLEKKTKPKKLPYWFPVFDLDVDRNFGYHSLIRDKENNFDLLNNKIKGVFEWHSLINLNFEWKIIEERFVSLS